MRTQLMTLRVLLPYAVFAEETGVTKMVVETTQGSFGILPRRLDCVAALVPGIIIFETEAKGEVCIAVGQGVLVKTGFDVRVSVNKAVGGAHLEELHAAVKRDFLNLNEQERNIRSVLGKMESSFVNRLVKLHRE